MLFVPVAVRKKGVAVRKRDAAVRKVCVAVSKRGVAGWSMPFAQVGRGRCLEVAGPGVGFVVGCRGSLVDFVEPTAVFLPLSQHHGNVGLVVTHTAAELVPLAVSLSQTLYL